LGPRGSIKGRAEFGNLPSEKRIGEKSKQKTFPIAGGTREEETFPAGGVGNKRVVVRLGPRKRIVPEKSGREKTRHRGGSVF